MGLDSVELVLAAEEEFEVSISDADAKILYTVGDLYKCIMRKIYIAHTPEDVFYRLQTLIVVQLGVKREDVVMEAKFVEDLGVD